MTAVDIIGQIKALSPEERAKVVCFIHEMESAPAPGVRYADKQAFAEAAQWTFNEHAELMRKLSE
jgi:hypothetical protein